MARHGAPGPGIRQELRDRLLAARRPDGGWPYYAGKSSRLEPTAWALLALRAAGEPVTAACLQRWPRREGLFVDRSSDSINFGFNGLAAIALAVLGLDDSSLIEGLIAARGVKLGESKVNRQDNSLQGWSWIEGTFSWVEPTAWALLALKKVQSTNGGSGILNRIDEAERLLIDRVCADGGWNYGNSNTLGADLLPHVPTSALGLLALFDKPSHPAVRRSLNWLDANRLRERSAMALGLTRIALGVFGRPAADVDAALEIEWRRTRYLENLHLAAIALYALSAAESGFEAFRV